ncbi:amino acid transporter [Zopfia rhizophila CBS 207.26]|uniref:Amino acid transporter n=1 Tax=Zopfia rhizophila CBS 207.26 TaxID=1314779 RepID=A0A6A6EQB3_9PEZI|nr:amino acid transporter [Zopfia rhizophila CBS 207.26]
MRFLNLFAAGLLSATLTAAAPYVKRNETGICTTNKRKAWQNLSDEEKAEYIDAELCLMNLPPKLGYNWAKNRWDEVVYGHVVQSNVIHDVGAFLPWHRLYMRAHEYILQTECNYTGAQPYWEEVLDVDDLAGSVVFDPETGFGGNSNGSCVTDGPFTQLQLHITQYTNYANYCLTRDFSTTIYQGANQTHLDECYASTTYEEAWMCYVSSPHTAGHGGVGGTMLDVVASPSDPLFFLHHTNLDRLWWEWQQANLSARLTDISGRNVPRTSYLAQNNFTYPGPEILDYDGDPYNVTTLNHTLWMVDLIPNATIADVMDLRGELICAEYV